MTDPRIIAMSSNPGQVEPGPFSEHELREQWNAQADEFNQWESLDLCEQLAWAQTRAIAANRFLPPVAKPTPVDLAALHDPGFSDGLTASQHLDVVRGGPDPRVPLKERPDFQEGYRAGFADGREALDQELHSILDYINVRLKVANNDLGQKQEGVGSDFRSVSAAQAQAKALPAPEHRVKPSGSSICNGTKTIIRDSLGRKLDNVLYCDPQTGEVISYVTLDSKGRPRGDRHVLMPFRMGGLLQQREFYPAPLTIEFEIEPTTNDHA